MKKCFFIRYAYYDDVTRDPPRPEYTYTPKKAPRIPIDDYIKESDGLYKQWWIHFKEAHPEYCITSEEKVKKPPPKPSYKPLTCKRCGRTWTPRSKEPPIQCPKCHSPYWNRERKKL